MYDSSVVKDIMMGGPSGKSRLCFSALGAYVTGSDDALYNVRMISFSDKSGFIDRYLSCGL